MPRLIPLTAVTLALALAVPVAAQDAALWSGPALTTTPMSEADAAVVDQLAQEVVSSPDLPGLWIGVWDPDKGYYLQAYGDAVKDGEAAAVEQHGRIGSVTKTFTVTAILQQVAEGNLSLDSTIGDILPALAEQYPEIAEVTVKQLAGMHSPIQDYANTGVITEQVIEDPQRVFTAEELIAAGMSLPLMDPEVGGYSTTNTIILGLMLEELTGQPVEQVVTEVAASLGMENTALQPPEETLMPEPASSGYVEAPGRASLAPLGLDIPAGTDVTDWTPSWGQAGGGMYSTIEDLGTWAGSGLRTSLLPVDLATERFDFQSIPEGQYGLGLFDYDEGWVGHTGQLLGWEWSWSTTPRPALPSWPSSTRQAPCSERGSWRSSSSPTSERSLASSPRPGCPPCRSCRPSIRPCPAGTGSIRTRKTKRTPCRTHDDCARYARPSSRGATALSPEWLAAPCSDR